MPTTDRQIMPRAFVDHIKRRQEAQARPRDRATPIPGASVKVHPYVELMEKALRQIGDSTSLWIDSDAEAFQLAGELSNDDLAHAPGKHVSGHALEEELERRATRRKLRFAGQVLNAGALRLLNPRVRLLDQHLAAARAATSTEIDPSYTRDRFGKLADALNALVVSREQQPGAQAFLREVSNLPADLDVCSLLTSEVVESFLSALVRVQTEASQADALMLKKLTDYLAALARIEREQCDETAEIERNQLTQRLAAITEKLDGSLLHTERLSVRREVDEVYAQLEGRLSRSERKRLEGRYAELGNRLQSLEDLRNRLIAQRDFVRSRLEQLGTPSTFQDPARAAAHDELRLRHELQGALQTRDRCFKRLAQVIRPLACFDWKSILAGGDQNSKFRAAGRVFKLWNRLAATVLARTSHERTLRVLRQLLECYWRSPTRVMRAVQLEALMLAESRGQMLPVESPIDDWVQGLQARADAGDTVEQFLLAMCRAAPGSIREELTFVYNQVNLSH